MATNTEVFIPKSINKVLNKLVDDLNPPPIYITSLDNKLTLDELLPRFPRGTMLVLANTEENDPDKDWCLEASPSWEFIESSGVWPWPTAKAWYGPTTESVINQADDDLRKAKR